MVDNKNYGHRPPQDRGSAGVHENRQGRYRRQRQAGGRFLARETGRMISCANPLELTKHLTTFDIKVTVNAAANPARPARCATHHPPLIDYDATLKPVLSKAGLVTRDAREVERRRSACTRRAAASSSPNADRLQVQAKRLPVSAAFLLLGCPAPITC